MLARRFRVLYVCYIIFNLFSIYLTFYVNLIDKNVLYSENFIYWEEATLSEKEIKSIYEEIDIGTVIVREENKIYIHDPDLYIQEKIYVEGRLFTTEEIENMTILPRGIAVGSDGFLPDLDNLEPGILGVFSSFDIFDHEIVEVMPLNRFNLNQAANIYYLHGQSSEQSHLSSIIGQDYLIPKEHVPLSLPKFKLRPIVPFSIQFLFVVFNILIYPLTYIIYTYHKEELIQYILFSKRRVRASIMKDILLANFLFYVIITSIVAIICLLLTNIPYTVTTVVLTTLNFFLSTFVVTKLTLRKWVRNV